MGDRALRCSRARPFLKGRPWAPRLRAKALVKNACLLTLPFRLKLLSTKSLGSKKIFIYPIEKYPLCLARISSKEPMEQKGLEILLCKTEKPIASKIALSERGHTVKKSSLAIQISASLLFTKL